MNAQIVIRRDREKPVHNQHPWIFSGAIDQIRGTPQPGEIVDVLSADGRFMARGYWNATSQIQVRILTWTDEPITLDWWRSRLQRAIALRGPQDMAGAQRLVNAENDFLPGLVVDRYADVLVLQALTLGIDQHKLSLAALLAELMPGIRSVYERSDVDVRAKEGLEQASGPLHGSPPPDAIEVVEGNARFSVDVRRGHKTGMYLDQAVNRRRLHRWMHMLPQGARMLNLFSYTGGFGLHALDRAGEITFVDSSHEALVLAERNVARTAGGHDAAARHAFVMGNAFQVLRDLALAREQFDCVVCDPPKFAHNAGQVEKAARGYKDLNLNSFRIIRPGGLLFTFSCSGAVSADLFQKIVFGALADSGRQGQIVEWMNAAPDHPVALTFPEGAYLKGLVVRVL